MSLTALLEHRRRDVDQHAADDENGIPVVALDAQNAAPDLIDDWEKRTPRELVASLEAEAQSARDEIGRSSTEAVLKAEAAAYSHAAALLEVVLDAQDADRHAPASPLFGCGPLHHGEALIGGESVLSLTLGGDLLAEVCVAGPYDSTEVMSAIVEAWNAHDRRSYDDLRPEGGVALIAAERQRQVTDEGWATKHDDGHTNGSLAMAACCYATPERLFKRKDFAAGTRFEDPWPWDQRWDKRLYNGNMLLDPGSADTEERVRHLVKAGALIAAEIDRLQRAETKELGDG